MWTLERRAQHDRSGLRYPSEMADEEWALVRPQTPRAKLSGNKRSVDERAVSHARSSLFAIILLLEQAEFEHLLGNDLLKGAGLLAQRLHLVACGCAGCIPDQAAFTVGRCA